MPRALRLPTGLKLMNLLLGGWTGVVFAFLYVPIILLVVFSFNESRLNLQWEGFTFAWYRKTFDDTLLMRGLKNSVLIALVSTALSVTLGTIGAWLLYRYRFPMRRLFNTLIFIPMAVPEIIMGISLLILFASVIRRLEDWQALATAPEWVAGMEFGLGYLTVIISHVTFCFPFVLVAVQARLAGVDPSLEEAAMDLGATPFRAFWHVMMPYMLPAIVSGALMAFTLSMDEVIVTIFTTGSESRTLPLVMFDRVKKGLDPSLNAVSTLFIVATIILVLVTEWLRRADRAISKS